MRLTLVVAFVLILLAFVPLVLIWSLNTLFTLAIPTTIDTYLAAWALTAIFRLSTSNVSK